MHTEHLTTGQRARRLAHRTLKALVPALPPLANELEWAPSGNFVLHDENVSTTISFSPLAVTRSPGTYFWEFRLYGDNPTQPIFTRKSRALALEDQETLTSAELCAAAGVDRLFNYCEVMAWSPDVRPVGVSSVLVSFHHFTSKDGRIEAHLPAAYIWGAARFTRTERFHYENFPAVLLSPEVRPIAYVMNPFVRPMRYWITLTDANGRDYEEGPFRVAGKGVSYWSGERIPLPQLASPAGLVVRSESKGNAFVGSLHLPTGRMVDLEHLHPFFSQ
ncbi:MAG: hypothetical protein JNK23_11500 [Opitutaceae bacterium]|nr:hypothetical protein [Opitutaceae bacterium]